MNKKIIILFLLIITLSFLASCRQKNLKTTNSSNESLTPFSAPKKSDIETAIAKAKALYSEKKAEGLDFSSSPCLSNDLLPDFVADIAHNPRQDIDNQKSNQCPAYLEGQAHHFVELDPDGNVIRTM